MNKNKPVSIARPAAAVFIVGFVAAMLAVMALGRGAAVSGPRQVRIITEPDGALVFINERLEGRAPCTVTIPAGTEAACTARHEGFLDARCRLGPDTPGEVTLTLAAVPTGCLAVTSEPSGATVFLEDAFIGKTPLQADAVPAGMYMVRLERANFLPFVAGVTVTAGAEAPVQAVLESKVEAFYKAAISAEPANIVFRTELGHYYLINSRKEECAAQYARALELAGAVSGKDREALGDVSRLLNEIKKIQNAQPDVAKQLDPAITAMVQSLLANKQVPASSLTEISRKLRMLGRHDLVRLIDGEPVGGGPGPAELRELERRALAAEKEGRREEAFNLTMELAGHLGRMEGEMVLARSIELLRKAAVLTDSRHSQVRIGIEIAEGYIRLDRPERACEVLVKVLELMPDDVRGGDAFWDVHRTLAELYIKRGLPEKAQTLYEKIITTAADQHMRETAEQELRNLP